MAEGEEEKRKLLFHEMVKELLDLYAARQVFEGFKFPPLDQFYQEFEATFEYEETPDQTQGDRRSDKRHGQVPNPWIGLICGDVGYGKTEVAIRAAYRAVDEREASRHPGSHHRSGPATLSDL